MTYSDINMCFDIDFFHIQTAFTGSSFEKILQLNYATCIIKCMLEL